MAKIGYPENKVTVDSSAFMEKAKGIEVKNGFCLSLGVFLSLDGVITPWVRQGDGSDYKEVMHPAEDVTVKCYEVGTTRDPRDVADFGRWINKSEAKDWLQVIHQGRQMREERNEDYVIERTMYTKQAAQRVEDEIILGEWVQYQPWRSEV